MVSAKVKPTDKDICGVRVIHINRVSQARDKEIPGKELNRLAQTYGVLGDPTRLRIVMALVGSEMCVCDLCSLLKMKQPTVCGFSPVKAVEGFIAG